MCPARRTVVRTTLRPARVCSLVAALLGAVASAAAAHMNAVPIERWGPFLPGSVTCMRVMSGATQECFDIALEIEQRCQDTLARGGTCDPVEEQAQTSAAVDTLVATVGAACVEGQLTEIGYFGLFDAEADLFDACVRQARNALAATYAPAATTPTAEPVINCMAASAAYGRKVMHYILERERSILERFATRDFAGDEKLERIRQMQLELSATRARWVSGLLEACPQFETIYRRTADTFLRTLKQRAECVLSKNYVNTAVFCAGQVCGNAVVEVPEQCDDGNDDDSDACRTDCTLARP